MCTKGVSKNMHVAKTRRPPTLRGKMANIFPVNGSIAQLGLLAQNGLGACCEMSCLLRDQITRAVPANILNRVKCIGDRWCRLMESEQRDVSKILRPMYGEPTVDIIDAFSADNNAASMRVPNVITNGKPVMYSCFGVSFLLDGLVVLLPSISLSVLMPALATSLGPAVSSEVSWS